MFEIGLSNPGGDSGDKLEFLFANLIKEKEPPYCLMRFEIISNVNFLLKEFNIVNSINCISKNKFLLLM